MGWNAQVSDAKTNPPFSVPMESGRTPHESRIAITSFLSMMRMENAPVMSGYTSCIAFSSDVPARTWTATASAIISESDKLLWEMLCAVRNFSRAVVEGRLPLCASAMPTSSTMVGWACLMEEPFEVE